jgi:hypothetical protein
VEGAKIQSRTLIELNVLTAEHHHQTSALQHVLAVRREQDEFPSMAKVLWAARNVRIECWAVLCREGITWSNAMARRDDEFDVVVTLAVYPSATTVVIAT